MAAQHLDHLGSHAHPRHHAVHEVGSVELTHQHVRLIEAELLDDVVANARRRGRGECVDARAGKTLLQRRQLPVLGAEVVTPVADAVRLVHGEGPHVQAVQQGEKARARQPLR